VEKSAKGIVGDATAEGPNDERQRIVTKRDGNASDHLRQQAAAKPQDELASGSSGQPESIHTQTLFAQVLERANLQRALKQVRRNKGAPGIDGMTVDELPDYLLTPLAGNTCATGNGPLSPATRQARGNTQGRRENASSGIPTAMDRRTSGPDTAGWWIWTCKPSSTGSIMTG
jgi:hypothetical protein